MAAITVTDLTKDYGTILGIDSLSFTVEEGEIFGVLGPNGAGKTTTIRTMLSLLEPTAGTATVLGADVHDEDALIDVKQRIGYLPADLGFNEAVTGNQLLDTTMDRVESDPLIQRIIVENELNQIRAHISDDEQENKQDEGSSAIAYFLPHIERWYDDGRVAGPDLETITYAIWAVTYLTVHIEEIGAERYPAVRDTVITAITAGLTRHSDKTDPTEDDHE